MGMTGFVGEIGFAQHADDRQRGIFANERSAARRPLEESGIGEPGHGFLHGRATDAPFLGELIVGGKSLAGFQLTRPQLTFDLALDLNVNRFRRIRFQIEIHDRGNPYQTNADYARNKGNQLILIGPSSGYGVRPRRAAVPAGSEFTPG